MSDRARPLVGAQFRIYIVLVFLGVSVPLCEISILACSFKMRNRSLSLRQSASRRGRKGRGGQKLEDLLLLYLCVRGDLCARLLSLYVVSVPLAY